MMSKGQGHMVIKSDNCMLFTNYVDATVTQLCMKYTAAAAAGMELHIDTTAHISS